ncbi:MAG: hypothetical protein ACRCZ9_08945 [Fusobacteriaceae bacterium]
MLITNIAFIHINKGVVECFGEIHNINYDGIVLSGDFEGYPANIVKDLLPLAKNAKGDWGIEAMLTPKIEKHIVFEVDGSLSRKDAVDKLVAVIKGTRCVNLSSVDDIFENFIIDEGGIKYVEETHPVVDRSNNTIYTAHSGGCLSDVVEFSLYGLYNTGEYFSIDWDSVED